MDDRTRAWLSLAFFGVIFLAGCDEVAFHLADRPRSVGGGAGGAAGADVRPESRATGGAGGAVGAGGTPAVTDGMAPTTCTEPLTFADPDVEDSVRQVTRAPDGPIHQADVSGLTDLNLIFANVPACPSGLPTCIDYVNPPHLDGWVTSLAGVECIRSIQRLGLDPFLVDLGPLVDLPKLAHLELGPTLETDIRPMPQVTSVTMVGGGLTTSILRALPSLMIIDSPGASDGWTPETGTVLAQLTGLITLRIQSCRPPGLAGIDLSNLGRLVDLEVRSCGLTDLSSLSGLAELTIVDLRDNMITDLSPLVVNPGIGVGDRLDVSRNALNCIAQGPNIATLRRRGVTIASDCP